MHKPYIDLVEYFSYVKISVCDRSLRRAQHLEGFEVMKWVTLSKRLILPLIGKISNSTCRLFGWGMVNKGCSGESQ